MANKVFIVTSGDYSDYGINSVFSTREKAQEWIDKHPCPSDYGIEEYEVDECASHVKLTRYEAEIDLENGDILQTRAHDWIGPNVRAELSAITDFRAHSRSSMVPTFGHLFGKVISYVSADHALKLAAECRQKWLRKKTGTGEATDG